MIKSKIITTGLLQVMLFIAGSNAAFADIAPPATYGNPLINAFFATLISILVSMFTIKIIKFKLNKEK